MRLVHVVPHVAEEASGPSYSVPRLCEALARRGHEVELSCLAARGLSGVTLDLHRQWRFPRKLAVSPTHTRALARKAGEVDIIHNHSLWSMVNVGAGLVVPGKRAKLVTAPRGTLTPWALNRTRHLKRLLKPLQWRALERADLLHATSQTELAEIRALGLRAPVAVIPNGIDLPKATSLVMEKPYRTLLFLSRVHPKKGIDRLMQAWRSLQLEHPDWRLQIAGCGEDAYVDELHTLAERLSLQRFEWLGPVYGEEKTRTYQGADVFVLPTHSENFGMVVAEALAHGRPVVVSRGAPWSGVVDERCGWWVDNDVDTLATTLDKAMRTPSESLAAMGRRGRDWMERDFGWDAIAEAMEAAYLWICGTMEKPKCVQNA